jgi:hypothetical protein
MALTRAFKQAMRARVQCSNLKVLFSFFLAFLARLAVHKDRES